MLGTPGVEILAENLGVLRVVLHDRRPTGSEGSGECAGTGGFGLKPKVGDRCRLKSWNSPKGLNKFILSQSG